MAYIKHMSRNTVCKSLMWEFPKIRAVIHTSNSRALFIGTPTKDPTFRKTAIYTFSHPATHTRGVPGSFRSVGRKAARCRRCSQQRGRWPPARRPSFVILLLFSSLLFLPLVLIIIIANASYDYEICMLLR